MHVSGEVRLQARPEDVWSYVTDPGHFSEFVSGWADGAPTGERATGHGARYAWTAKLGPVALHAAERVTEWKERDRVSFEGEMAGVPFRSSMSLAPVDQDTRLRVDIDYEVPGRRGGRVGETLLRPLIRRSVRASLARLGGHFGAATPPASDHALSRDEVIDLYRKRARSYDAAVRLYELVGFDTQVYRARAADALRLRPGATVVEIGCGTGLNLPLLRDRVGPSGRVIGVDLTDAMLDRARRRVREHGWDNVELVRSDAAEYPFPAGVDGILSTLALTLSPQFDAVIAAGAGALSRGGRWVILDLKYPAGWPEWMVRLGLVTMRPYGVSLAVSDRHPWESLRKHLPHTGVEDLFFGAAYLAWGERG